MSQAPTDDTSEVLSASSAADRSPERESAQEPALKLLRTEHTHQVSVSALGGPALSRAAQAQAGQGQLVIEATRGPAFSRRAEDTHRARIEGDDAAPRAQSHLGPAQPRRKIQLWRPGADEQMMRMAALTEAATPLALRMDALKEQTQRVRSGVEQLSAKLSKT